jgi:hypothetical protein
MIDHPIENNPDGSWGPLKRIAQPPAFLQLWNVGGVLEARRACHVAHFIRPIIFGPIGSMELRHLWILECISHSGIKPNLLLTATFRWIRIETRDPLWGLLLGAPHPCPSWELKVFFANPSALRSLRSPVRSHVAMDIITGLTCHRYGEGGATRTSQHSAIRAGEYQTGAGFDDAPP